VSQGAFTLSAVHLYGMSPPWVATLLKQ